MVPGSLLQSVLEELQELCEQTFLLAIQSQVKQQLSQHLEAPPSDLSPLSSVSHLLNLLQEVLSVSSVGERRQQDVIKVKGHRSCVVFVKCRMLLYIMHIRLIGAHLRPA